MTGETAELVEELAAHIVPIRAFSESGIVEGRMAFHANRLTDELNNQELVTVRDASIFELESLNRYDTPHLTIPRSRVSVVQGAGPRGDIRHRFRTWPHEVTVIVGRYRVAGAIHTVPGGSPTWGFYHRSLMVPITDAVVSYVLLGRVIEEAADIVVVNRDSVTSIVLTRDAVRAGGVVAGYGGTTSVITPHYLPRPPRR